MSYYFEQLPSNTHYIKEQQPRFPAFKSNLHALLFLLKSIFKGQVSRFLPPFGQPPPLSDGAFLVNH